MPRCPVQLVPFQQTPQGHRQRLPEAAEPVLFTGTELLQLPRKDRMTEPVLDPGETCAKSHQSLLRPGLAARCRYACSLERDGALLQPVPSVPVTDISTFAAFAEQRGRRGSAQQPHQGCGGRLLTLWTCWTSSRAKGAPSLSDTWA